MTTNLNGQATEKIVTPGQTNCEMTNKFSDLTYKKFLRKYTGLILPEEPPCGPPALSTMWSPKEMKRRVPKNFEWSDTPGVIHSVKNQLGPSCWANAAAGALEALHFLSTWTSVGLSVQQIVDCTHATLTPYEKNTCDGGWAENFFNGIQMQVTDESYTSYDNGCEDLNKVPDSPETCVPSNGRVWRCCEDPENDPDCIDKDTGKVDKPSCEPSCGLACKPFGYNSSLLVAAKTIRGEQF